MGLKVVQWGTGNVGRHALRAVLEHPELELAGCYVTSAAKSGRDVAELLGLDEPVGVRATDDVEAILGAPADVVLHMPLPAAQVADDPDFDTKTLCRLLASGKNVVTTVGYVYPKAYGPDVEARLERACADGGVSLHGTGANPGFMSELVPLVFSGLCRRIDRVYVKETSEFSRYPSPEVILGMMGFGKHPDDFEAHSVRYRRWLSGLFAESVLMVADGLGVELDSLDVDEQTTVATEDLTIAAGLVARGTVAGQRWVWSGTVAGRPVVELEAVYRAHPSVAPEWGAGSWALRIDGDPWIRLELDRWVSNGLLATAMHAVHAIPHVVAAPSGVRTFLDLPLIVGRHSVAS